MSEMSPQRRRIVVIAAGIAAMSGAVPLLLRNHPYLRIGVLAFMVCGLVYVLSEMVKMKRGER